MPICANGSAYQPLDDSRDHPPAADLVFEAATGSPIASGAFQHRLRKRANLQ